MKIKNNIENLLKGTGITLNGSNPWDPQVYSDDIYEKIAQGGSIALGEAFMDKAWDVDDLSTLIYKIQKGGVEWEKLAYSGLLLFIIKSKLFNLQIGKRAYEVGTEHYDLGNDLYAATLDKRMIYTSAYWKDANTLDEAQEAKLDLICKKLDLKKGQRVLDVGCGWGGFMKYASENYGVECVGISVSKEQTAYGKKVCEGLPIQFEIIDYQKYSPTEKFDHVVSIEMIEAVGHKNFRTYMKKIHEWLKEDGSFLLQVIESTSKKPVADPWIDKYIFPNGRLPNKKMLEESMKGLFTVSDWHSSGRDYDKTLMAWWSNFDSNYNTLDKNKYNERFYRMWKYYLQICAAGFRSGYTDVSQLLLVKGKYQEQPKIR